MKNLFLVDYENVGPDGLKGLEGLDESSEVMIFYSFKAQNLTWDLHEKIKKCKANFILKKVSVGFKDALDFQLSSYIGYIITKKSYENLIIISNDRGYEAIIRFWKEESDIDFISNSPDIEHVLNNILVEQDRKIKNIIEGTGGKIAETEIIKLEKLIKENKKDEIHNFLQSKYGFRKGDFLYNKFKKKLF